MEELNLEFKLMLVDKSDISERIVFFNINWYCIFDVLFGKNVFVNM